MILLERLVQADPEHFEYNEDNLTYYISLKDGELPVGFTREFFTDSLFGLWPLAGWCLEQMQARRRAVQSLIWLATLPELDEIRPVDIITAYCEWKEATKEVTP